MSKRLRMRESQENHHGEVLCYATNVKVKSTIIDLFPVPEEKSSYNYLYYLAGSANSKAPCRNFTNFGLKRADH